MKKLPVQDIFAGKSTSVKPAACITAFNETGYGNQRESNLLYPIIKE